MVERPWQQSRSRTVRLAGECGGRPCPAGWPWLVPGLTGPGPGTSLDLPRAKSDDPLRHPGHCQCTTDLG
eukprot:3363966-Rhodomonas_salina.1